jgi:non-specific serine/threonine protein kinase
MLALIRQKLDELEIKNEYFDGGTSAPDRRKRSKAFKMMRPVKVFLISLKAGGVGLNLTAADYVYSVDPWWNPAVEQQAIARTHTYRPNEKHLCLSNDRKDTIEDKILQLPG